MPASRVYRDPDVDKPKHTTTCTHCRLRRVRCNRGNPCSTCIARGMADECDTPLQTAAIYEKAHHPADAAGLTREIERIERMYEVLERLSEEQDRPSQPARSSHSRNLSGGQPSRPASRSFPSPSTTPAFANRASPSFSLGGDPYGGGGASRSPLIGDANAKARYSATQGSTAPMPDFPNPFSSSWLPTASSSLTTSPFDASIPLFGTGSGMSSRTSASPNPFSTFPPPTLASSSSSGASTTGSLSPFTSSTRSSFESLASAALDAQALAAALDLGAFPLHPTAGTAGGGAMGNAYRGSAAVPSMGIGGEEFMHKQPGLGPLSGGGDPLWSFPAWPQ